MSNQIDGGNKKEAEGFPGGSVVKNLPARAGDTGLILVQEDPTCHRTMKSMHHSY